MVSKGKAGGCQATRSVCLSGKDKPAGWSGHRHVKSRTPELRLVRPPRLLCPSVRRPEARSRYKVGSSVAELMPRASHFIPARMNGLIVGNRAAAARGLHGIMAALASCPPDLRVPGRAARRAGLEGGSSSQGEQGDL